MHRGMNCLSVLQAKVHCEKKWKLIFSKRNTCYSTSSTQTLCILSEIYIYSIAQTMLRAGGDYMHNYKTRTNSNKYTAGLPLGITVAFQEDRGLFCLEHYFLHLTKRKEVIWGKEDDNITTVNAELT